MICTKEYKTTSDQIVKPCGFFFSTSVQLKQTISKQKLKLNKQNRIHVIKNKQSERRYSRNQGDMEN